MDSASELFLGRAENELNLSVMILKISGDKELQVKAFGMKEDTYYSAAIAHAYYSIFYAAKAYLLKKGLKTAAPEEHKKTYDAFARLVQDGTVDVELLQIYRNAFMKAGTLLHIFEFEKSRRGTFTYKRIPQANREPAQGSVEHAKVFYGHLFRLVGRVCKNSL